jgi:hypothetical protein
MILEVLPSNADERRSVFTQSLVHALSITSVVANENVKILCSPRFGVLADRMAAYDEIFNAVCVENSQYVFLIVPHSRRRPWRRIHHE